MKQTPLDQDMSVVRLVQIALAEDIGTGDVTAEATVDPDRTARAIIRMKTDGVLCGTLVAQLVASEVDRDLSITWTSIEGASIPRGTSIALVAGPLGSLLTAERTILNFLQRMSGVATLTRKYVDAVAGSAAKVTDTRKTIPGWRRLDKYSVLVGGGVNHRIGLYDMAMIKDNHIAACGSIAAAVRRTVESMSKPGTAPPSIEVEVASLDQVAEAVECPGITRIMFDNMTCSEIAAGVRMVGGRLVTEASGGVTLDSIREIAATGVDFISVGALTHSAPAADISLDIETSV